MSLNPNSKQECLYRPHMESYIESKTAPNGLIISNTPLTIDSREVARVIGKRHDNLIADIRGYMKGLELSTDLKFEGSEFFIRSEYTNDKGAARVISKNHRDLLRDIMGYIEDMEDCTERKIAPSGFFIKSEYTYDKGNADM